MSSAPLTAHPAPSGSVGHEPPRLSASGAERHFACKSSHAREVEYYEWAQAMGIEGLGSSDAADRGKGIHKLTSVVPYTNPDFGLPSSPVRPQIEAIAAKEAPLLNSYDHWVATRFVERRNEFIDWLIANFPDGPDAVEQIEVTLDTERLGVGFTGTPDVRVVVAGGGRSIAGVLDYKSGQGVHKEAHENKQLAVLATLAWRHKGSLPTPELVYTVLMCEPEVNEPLQIGRYTAAELEAVAVEIKESERIALPLAQSVRDNPNGHKNDLPATLDSVLDLNANVGSHCLNCSGKVCCGAMKIAASVALDKLYTLHAYTEANPISPAMDTKKLTESMQISSSLEPMQKLLSRYHEEAEALAFQVISKGEKLDGVVIEEGQKRISLEEQDPAKLFELLKPVLETKAGRPVDLNEFAAGVGKAGKVSASGLRSYLSTVFEVPEHKTVESLKSAMTALGQKTPLDQKPTSPSLKHTGDLSDVVHEIGMQTRERIRTAVGLGGAGRAAEAPEPAAGVKKPLDTQISAIVGEAPPKRGRKPRATAQAPSEGQTPAAIASEASQPAIAAPESAAPAPVTGVAIFC